MAPARSPDPLGDTADPRLYVPRGETEHALGLLEEFLQPSRDGPRVAVLSGPSGLGKTLLVRVLASRAARTRCVFYAPFLHFLPDEASAWLLELLGAGGGRGAHPAHRLAQLLGAGRDPPLLLIVDEAQATPAETAAFLGSVVAKAQPALRVVLVGLEGRALDRVVHGFGLPVLEMRLGPGLDEAEVGDLLDAALAWADLGEPARSLLARSDASALLAAAAGANPQRLKRILVGMSRGIVPEPFLAAGEAPVPAPRPSPASPARIPAAAEPLALPREAPSGLAGASTMSPASRDSAAEPALAASRAPPPPRARRLPEVALARWTRARAALGDAARALRLELHRVGERIASGATRTAHASRDRLLALGGRVRERGGRLLRSVRIGTIRAASLALEVSRRSAARAVARTRARAERGRLALADAARGLRSSLRRVAAQVAGLAGWAARIADMTRTARAALGSRARERGQRLLRSVRTPTTEVVSRAVEASRRGVAHAAARAGARAAQARRRAGAAWDRSRRVASSQRLRARSLARNLAADLVGALRQIQLDTRRRSGAVRSLAAEHQATLRTLLLAGLVLALSLPLGPPTGPSSRRAAPAVESTAARTPPAVSAAPPQPAAPPSPADTVTIHVNARPWAQIWLDGVDLGPTPLSHDGLAPGSYRIEARFPDGRRVVRTVAVRPETRFISFR